MVCLDYRYEKEAHEKLLSFKYFSDRTLGFSVCDDVYLIPKTEPGKSGGAYTADGKLIPETATNLEYGCPSIALDSTDIANVISAPCIYMGVYESVWGHFITDCLKKLWFLKSEAFQQFAGAQLVFLSAQAQKLGENHKRLLELLDIDVSQVCIVTANTKVKRMIVPDSCFYYDEQSVIHYTKEYAELIDQIRSHFSCDGKSQYEKIYYSYAGYSKNKGYKKTFGEQKLERFFGDRGYLIVHPEKHTLDEQLMMLAQCKHFAATEGSTSHNSVFLKGAEIIIIPRGPYFSGYQQTIDAIEKENTVYYVDAALTAFASKNGPWGGPNYYHVSEELMSFFHLPEEERALYRRRNFKDIKQYMTYCMIALGGRNYCINSIYAEKFFYYLGTQSRELLPVHFLKHKLLMKLRRL